MPVSYWNKYAQQGRNLLKPGLEERQLRSRSASPIKRTHLAHIRRAHSTESTSKQHAIDNEDIYFVGDATFLMEGLEINDGRSSSVLTPQPAEDIKPHLLRAIAGSSSTLNSATPDAIFDEDAELVFSIDDDNA